MRIIAGRLGGRNFNSPSNRKTHPMSDKVRGALFGALGDIEGLTVLDAFAGSGALSLEAVSRGAASVVAIDSDKRAQQAIAENIQSLKLGPQIKLIKANCSVWSDNNPDQLFDLVLADPPYDTQPIKAILKMSLHVKPKGLLVLSWPGKQKAPQIENYEIASHKNYGDAQLVFYRRIQ